MYRKFDGLDFEETNEDDQLVPYERVNFTFCDKLLKLQCQARINQYLLACLSTLGGAYHLCNHPKQALFLAKKQEIIGLQMHNTVIITRSRVFQAVNWGLLGKRNRSKRIFRQCLEISKKHGSSYLENFVTASIKWLRHELQQLESESTNDSPNTSFQHDSSYLAICQQTETLDLQDDLPCDEEKS